MNRPKPRIFTKFYPSLKRRYWKVSLMPKPFNVKDSVLWNAAHKWVYEQNSKEQEQINAKRNAKTVK